MAKDTFNLNEWVGNKERRLLKEDHNSYAEGQEKELIDLLPGEKVPLDLPMINEQRNLEDKIANEEFGMDFDQLGENEKEWVRDEIQNYHEDIDTGGYVENMNLPVLNPAIDEIIEVWEEWKNGPTTETYEIPIAHKALVKYIENKLDLDRK